MEPTVPNITPETNPKSKKIALIVLLVVALALGGFWFFKHPIQSKPVVHKFVPDAEHAEANLKEITAAHLLTGKDIKIIRSSSARSEEGISRTTLVYTSTTPASEMATLYGHLLPSTQYTVTERSIKDTKMIIAEKTDFSMSVYLKSTSTGGTEVTLIYDKK